MTEKFQPTTPMTPELMQEIINNPSSVSALFRPDPITLTSENLKEHVNDIFAPTTLSPNEMLASLQTRFVHTADSAVLAVAAMLSHTLAYSLASFNELREDPNPQARISAIIGTFMSEITGVRGPLRITPYDAFLTPMSAEEFNVMPSEAWKYIQNEARRLIIESAAGKIDVPKETVEHWHSINKGVVPFGYTLEVVPVTH